MTTMAAAKSGSAKSSMRSTEQPSSCTATSGVKTVKTNPKAAQKALDAFSIKAMTDAENLTEDLMNQLFTVRTEDIQKVNFFANRSKKD